MKILLFVIVLVFSGSITAQTIKAADPEDVGSVDAIMKAVYDVISGDAGKVVTGTVFVRFFTRMQS